ncbi:13196_t:CDS:2, partial [Racocetra persica]
PLYISANSSINKRANPVYCAGLTFDTTTDPTYDKVVCHDTGGQTLDSFYVPKDAFPKGDFDENWEYNPCCHIKQKIDFVEVFEFAKFSKGYCDKDHYEVAAKEFFKNNNNV